MQGWLKICKIIQYDTLIERKSYINTSIDAEKASDKIQHPFMKKTLNKLGIEGIRLNIIEVI